MRGGGDGLAPAPTPLLLPPPFSGRSPRLLLMHHARPCAELSPRPRPGLSPIRGPFAMTRCPSRGRGVPSSSVCHPRFDPHISSCLLGSASVPFIPSNFVFPTGTLCLPLWPRLSPAVLSTP